MAKAISQKVNTQAAPKTEAGPVQVGLEFSKTSAGSLIYKATSGPKTSVMLGKSFFQGEAPKSLTLVLPAGTVLGTVAQPKPKMTVEQRKAITTKALEAARAARAAMTPEQRKAADIASLQKRLAKLGAASEPAASDAPAE